MARSALWAVGLALAVSGCGSSKDGPLADAAQSTFYQQLAAKNYQAIYDAASPELKQGIAGPTFIGFLQRVDRKMGVCQSPVKTANWRFNYTTNGYYQDQGYTRVCANGTLTETVSIVVRNGQAQLFGFHTDNPLLMTD